MSNIIKKLLNESLVFEIIDSLIDEDYPSNFSMDDFKKLTSFRSRIQYCEEHLTRISSGSSRIVYKIDNQKVLKLAKNKKGLAQNEIEIEYSQYSDLDDILARTFDYENNNLWVEMELARKCKKSDFKRITGFDFDTYGMVIHNQGEDSQGRRGQKYDVPSEIVDEMWENEFTYSMLDFVGSYQIPAGDLRRLSSYGIVKRNGQDEIVLIDYGLTNDVYQSYYS